MATMGRIVTLNVAMVLAWLPLIFVARNLIDRVIQGSPSDDLLEAAHLAVIGTLVIITAVYLFGIVLANKFATQNADGAQQRIVRPVLLFAAALYVTVGVIIFA
ncbi:MAG: hypothetical protein H7X80_05430 [bacterium]|nr:hypothetical protein [Candidatus Kapabacteria bacterium]